MFVSKHADFFKIMAKVKYPYAGYFSPEKARDLYRLFTTYGNHNDGVISNPDGKMDIYSFTIKSHLRFDMWLTSTDHREMTILLTLDTAAPGFSHRHSMGIHLDNGDYKSPYLYGLNYIELLTGLPRPGEISKLFLDSDFNRC